MHKPILPDPDWIVGKHALMNVHALLRNGRTEIDPHSWRIPFQWQGYHHQDHDDQPFMLLLNSSGGFVEGDISHFYATLDADTRALFTTTASNKFYKCTDSGISREFVDIKVGPRALLEYYPDEAIPFKNSRVHRVTRISMEENSRLFATDMISAGRIHYGAGEAFKFHTLSSEFAKEVEESVNKEVQNELDIEINIMEREEAFKIPDLIRTKINLLPDSIQQIRTVNITGLDLQADGGTHVNNTKEVGKIIVIGHESKGKINKRLRIKVEN